MALLKRHSAKDLHFMCNCNIPTGCFQPLTWLGGPDAAESATNLSLDSLSQDLALLQSEKSLFSDVTLVVGDKVGHLLSFLPSSCFILSFLIHSFYPALRNRSYLAPGKHHVKRCHQISVITSVIGCVNMQNWQWS